MVPSMALTTHMVTTDGVGPGPSWGSTLDYVQVVDLGGYLMLRPVYGDGLTVNAASLPTYASPPTYASAPTYASSATYGVSPSVDLSWTTPPESRATEPMGT